MRAGTVAADSPAPPDDDAAACACRAEHGATPETRCSMFSELSIECIISRGAIARRRQEALRTRPLIMFTISLSKKYDILHGAYGGMAEWLKAAVLKTVEPQGSVGSNPTSSARLPQAPAMGLFSCPGEPGRRGRRIRTGRSCRPGNMPAGMFPGAAGACAKGQERSPKAGAGILLPPPGYPKPQRWGFSCPAEPGRREGGFEPGGHAPPGEPSRTREGPLVGGLRFLVALFDFNAGERGVRAARARVRRSAASPDEMGASPYSTPSRCLRS